MQSFIVFVSCLAVASAGVIQNYGLGYSGIAVAPGATATQYHAQDELGQYSYGYSGGPSAKSETRTADGITRGGYSYVDANGILQSAQYVSDPVNGFRVSRTDLPVGPAPVGAVVAAPAYAAAPVAYAAPVATAFAAPIHYSAVPLPVQDTPEVQIAKAQHFAAHAEAKARSGIYHV